MDMEESLRKITKFFWFLLISLLEWFLPRSFYAKQVDQEVVLITGAGSGLGRALSLEFAKLGSHLVLWDINLKDLEETKKLILEQYSKNNIESKKDCLIYQVDVGDKEQVKRHADIVHRDLNKDKDNSHQREKYVSILINNAGIYHVLLLEELKDEQIEKIFRINILAHFWTVRAFLPRMIKKERGHIVEIASMAGLFGLHKHVDYCATKFATVGFEESLSLELAYLGLSEKIQTTVICPHFFRSNLYTGFNDEATRIMEVEHVARETVLTIRCNHSRLVIPKLMGYTYLSIKPFIPRKALILINRSTGIAEGIKNVIGAATLASKKD